MIAPQTGAFGAGQSTSGASDVSNNALNNYPV